MGKITINEAGDAIVTNDEQSLIDTTITVVTAPIKAFSSDANTYVSESTLGYAALAWFGAGVVVGQKFGDRIPLINNL